MPNMSRRSLEHHQDRINEMATNNPVQESYIRSRYQTSYDKFQKFDTSIDSQDEFDADEFDAYRTTSIYQKREEKTSIIRRFFTAIVTFIYTTWHKTCRIFTSEQDYRSVRYTRLNENKGMVMVWRMNNFSINGFFCEIGFFSRVASSFTSTFLSIFRYIYLIIASIQFWDSCFLQSSNVGNRGKKRFLLLLLLLLPLLLLAGE